MSFLFLVTSSFLNKSFISLASDSTPPSDFGDPSCGLRDYDDMGLGGAEHAVPSSTITSHEANEGLPVHDTTAQESIRHDEPEILQEELLVGRVHG